LSAGVQISAEADRTDVVQSEEFTVNLHSRCRPEIPCLFSDPAFFSARPFEKKAKVSGKPEDSVWSLALGKLPPYTTSPSEPDYGVTRISATLAPEPGALLQFTQSIQIFDYSFSPTTAVTHTAATSTSVSRVPVRIVPAFALAVEPTQAVEILSQPQKSFDIFLRVHSYSTKSAKVPVGLETPDGFTASAPVEVSFDGIGDQYAKLTVTPPTQLAAGNYAISAYAKRGDEKFSTSLEPLPTMPTILWSEPAQTVVHAFDINVPANLRVGYISAEGEMIPEALKRLGISVEMLDANALNFGDLSKYSAIVVGVRAYELRPELESANKRLLEYVSNGGTLVVQYNRDFI